MEFLANLWWLWLALIAIGGIGMIYACVWSATYVLGTPPVAAYYLFWVSASLLMIPWVAAILIGTHKLFIWVVHV